MDKYANYKYYKGEEECPFDEQNKQMLWEYERSYSICGDDIYAIAEYRSLVGIEFMKDDNISLEPKALLFNRYAKGCSSLQDARDGFKEFYKKYYSINAYFL